MQVRALVAAGVVAVVVTAAAGAVTGAPGRTVAPSGTLYGASYDQWLARWLRWAVTPPVARNPLAKSTTCTIAPQPGRRVWFLVASSGGRITQSCTVPSGRALFVPLALNVVFPSKPGETPAVLRSQAATVFKQVTVLRASVDGVPVTGVRGYRARSRFLTLGLPRNNLFGVPAGPRLVSADGFVLLLRALPSGAHVVTTYAEFHAAGQPTFKAGMTYKLTVQ